MSASGKQKVPLGELAGAVVGAPEGVGLREKGSQLGDTLFGDRDAARPPDALGDDRRPNRGAVPEQRPNPILVGSTADGRLRRR
jgi:hypothetical protein